MHATFTAVIITSSGGQSIVWPCTASPARGRPSQTKGVRVQSPVSLTTGSPHSVPLCTWKTVLPNRSYLHIDPWCPSDQPLTANKAAVPVATTISPVYINYYSGLLCVEEISQPLGTRPSSWKHSLLLWINIHVLLHHLRYILIFYLIK